MEIYKHRLFHRWAKSEDLTDAILKHAIDEMKKGLYEANLGSGLYKKRLAISGKGKRSGYRILIAFQQEEKAFFIYGFAKNARENINESEKKIYRSLAKNYLNMDKNAIQKMIDTEKLFEVL